MILLTADLDWNPSSLDYGHDDEHWFDAMESLPDLNCNHLFDEHGDYLHTHEIEVNLKKLENTSNTNNTLIDNDQILCAAYPHEMFDSQSYFQSIQPQFGWLPINIIMKSLRKQPSFIAN